MTDMRVDTPAVTGVEKKLWITLGLIAVFMTSPLADIIVTLLFWTVLGMPVAFVLMFLPVLSVLGAIARLSYLLLRRILKLPKAVCGLFGIGVALAAFVLPPMQTNQRVVDEVNAYLAGDRPATDTLGPADTLALVTIKH